MSRSNAWLWLRSIILLALKISVPVTLLFSLFVLLGMPGPFLWFGNKYPLLDALQVGLILFAMVAVIGLVGYLALLCGALVQRLLRRRPSP